MPKEFYSNNPYLNSIVYEAASLYPAGSDPNLSSSTDSSSSNKTAIVEYQSLYLKPFHAAQVVEPLLSDVRPSLWTAVCDDDKLMRDILQVFLRCEYPFTAAFQEDLFLEDMASQWQDFCSPLLVNITLAYACVFMPKINEVTCLIESRSVICRLRIVLSIGTLVRSYIAFWQRQSACGS
jgi:hypothetical protein